MKNRFSITLAAMLCCIMAMAVPARKGFRTYVQPDGSEVSIELTGDENFHLYLTSDGLPVECRNDAFYYLTSEGPSDVLAHEPLQRSAGELKFIETNKAELQPQVLLEVALNNPESRVAKAQAQRKAAPQKAASSADSELPVTGNIKVPVILVQFPDKKFKDSDPVSTFNTFFNSTGVSAKQYFADQSNGQLNVEFSVYGPVTTANKRSYYGGSASNGNDEKVGTMTAEGLFGVASSVTFADFDNNSDNYCDVVIVVFAGTGQASSGTTSDPWPCQWYLSASDYGSALKQGSTIINKFATFNELYYTGKKIDGIGTFCHEFSHCLGLPDFYDVKYSGYAGMGEFSLMDYGNYANDGFTPIGYSAYEKMFMNWITPSEGVENTHYTLPVFNQKSAATDVAVKVTSDYSANEYYLLENRKKQGWDAYFPAEGMMITHVTYNATAWNNNTVNTGSPQRMCLIPADGSFQSHSGQAGDLWPFDTKNALTDTSSPAATLNGGTGYMSKPITDITRNLDGTVSFWFMYDDTKPAIPDNQLECPIDIVTDNVGHEAFDLSWGDPNGSKFDTDITYDLEIRTDFDFRCKLVVEENFGATFLSDWTHSVNAVWAYSGGGGRVEFGSDSYSGNVTSPKFEIENRGCVTVIFEAKYTSSNGGNLTLNLVNKSGGFQATTKVAPTSSKTKYGVLFSDLPDGSYSVQFAALKGYPMALYSVYIYIGDATPWVNDSAAAPAHAPVVTYNDNIMSVTGIEETHYSIENLKLGSTLSYRVRAVPADTETYEPSAWSDWQTVNLLITGIDTPEAGAASTDPERTVEYYNLLGAKVAQGRGGKLPDNLQPGLYIMKSGTEARKVYIK